jgi:hypothetical protein
MQVERLIVDEPQIVEDEFTGQAIDVDDQPDDDQGHRSETFWSERAN